MREHQTSGPLAGITVVSLEHAVAAPIATRQLADLGARVIKIERPGSGDFARHYDERVRGLASYFVWANRGKQSVTLDMKQPAGAHILQQLISQADVFVQNLGPGAAARLGLSHETLRAEHPRLIVCDISGYGSSGPYADKKAYDLLIQAEAGLLSITGTPEHPAKAGCSIADISAGSHAYASILAALFERGRTGVGQRIDISLFESLVEWMGHALYYAFDGAAPQIRSGATHATIYPYGPFRCGEGGDIILAVQNNEEWKRFCADALGRPALAGDPLFNSNSRRVAARQALEQIIIAAFAHLTASQLVERLDSAGIANARINDMAAVWSHEQLAARERWMEMDSEVGRLPTLAPPGRSRAQMPPSSVPALGEHTHAVLRELGYESEAIDQLRVSGII